MRDLLQPIVDDAIQRLVTPGLVVLIGQRSEIMYHFAFGDSASPLHGGKPVQPSTIYDVASITKAAVTSTLLMGLVAERKLTLDSPVAPYLPELRGNGKDNIRLHHLLGHASGLPAHRPFHQRISTDDLAGADTPRDALIQMSGHTPLTYPTGSQTIYSDLGYMLLGRLIERVSGTPLETLFLQRVSGPLHLLDTGFSPQIRNKLGRIAPSQNHPTRGLIHGQVHDDNAHAGGGICGHAGLFTTAQDLAKLAGALCRSFHGDGFLPSSVVRDFWTIQAAPHTSWRMGFDTPSSTPGVSHCGDHWPMNSVGHLGFTGTSWWLTPQQEVFVIILSNRVYYSWEKTGIKHLRRAIMNTVAHSVFNIDSVDHQPPL